MCNPIGSKVHCTGRRKATANRQQQGEGTGTTRQRERERTYFGTSENRPLLSTLTSHTPQTTHSIHSTSPPHTRMRNSYAMRIGSRRHNHRATQSHTPNKDCSHTHRHTHTHHGGGESRRWNCVWRVNRLTRIMNYYQPCTAKGCEVLQRRCMMGLDVGYESTNLLVLLYYCTIVLQYQSK
jgi:hypothetical protein